MSNEKKKHNDGNASGKRKCQIALWILLILFFSFAVNIVYTLSNGPKLQKNRPIGLIVSNKSIEQPFVACENGLTGISYMLSTYGRKNTRHLAVSVLDTETDEIISKKEFSPEEITDNATYKQNFSAQENSKGRAYKIVFESKDISPKNALSVQGVPVSNHLPESIYGGSPVNGYSIFCECAYQVISLMSGVWVSLCVAIILCLGMILDRGLAYIEKKKGITKHTVGIKRQSNIELLRLILMFLIILHHGAFSGPWGKSIWQPTLMIGFTVLTYWHVIAFVAISGWFGINFTWLKFIRFWGIVFFYSALPLLLDKIIYGREIDPTQFIGPNKRLWFVGPYMVLMLISPILNSAVEYLHKKRQLFKTCILFAFVIFACWGPNNFGTFIDVKGAGPSSALTLIFIYFSTRAIKVSGMYNRMTRFHLIGLFIASLLGISCWGIVANINDGFFNPIKWFSRYVFYDNLLLIAAGICVVIYFAQYVRIPARWNSIILYLSKSAFALYLLQSVYTFNIIRANIPLWFSYKMRLSPATSIFLASIVIFVGFLGLDIVRRLLLSTLTKVFLFISKTAQSEIIHIARFDKK